MYHGAERVKNKSNNKKQVKEIIRFARLTGKNMENEIKFYSVNGKYGEFSNFARFPITIGKVIWPTTEHYFQAQKFKGTKFETKIRKMKRPNEAARLGRDRSLPLRRDWESVKIGVMKEALIAKFTQHNNLKELLLSTEDSVLIEHTDNDSYWGDGGNGTGKNMLGKLLMGVRSVLSKS